MPRRNPILEAVTDPGKNFLAFFVIGVLLFNVFSDGISTLFWNTFGDWLQQQLGIRNEATIQALILLGLVVLILLAIYSTDLTGAVRRLLSRLNLVDTFIPEDARVAPIEETCRGLVAIMSMSDDSPAEVAIRHHWNNGTAPCLEHCWLITTPSSLDYARKLQQKLVDEGIAERVAFYYGEYSIADINDPQQDLTLNVDDDAAQDPDTILHLVNSIYAHADRLGLDEPDLIVDFTGGTKPLGVGAFLACTSPGRRLEYIASRENPQLLEIKIDYRLKPAK
jgi:hypothetical protein